VRRLAVTVFSLNPGTAHSVQIEPAEWAKKIRLKPTLLLGSNSTDDSTTHSPAYIAAGASPPLHSQTSKGARLRIESAGSAVSGMSPERQQCARNKPSGMSPVLTIATVTALSQHCHTGAPLTGAKTCQVAKGFTPSRRAVRSHQVLRPRIRRGVQSKLRHAHISASCFS
jgi:hypothetical protein